MSLTSLYSSGEDGAYYINDASTLYTDTGKTTNVTPTDEIAVAEDQSGNGNDLVFPAGNRPTYEETGEGVGYWDFDGTNNYGENTTALGFPWMVSSYQRVTDGVNAGRLFDNFDSNSLRGYAQTNFEATDPRWRHAVVFANTEHTTSGSLVIDADERTVFEYNDASSRFFKNNTLDSTNDLGATVGQDGWTVGNQQGGGTSVPFTGRMYGWLIIDRILTDAERGEVDTYWQTLTETGGGGDQTISVPEVGSGADDVSISADASVAETGAGSDDVGISASLSVQDSGSGADDISAQIQALVEDVGSGLDEIAVIQVTVPIQDTGSGADAITINVDLSVAESGSGSDAITVLKEVLKTVSEVGTGTDAVSTTVDLAVQDAGAGVDDVSISASVVVQDVGAGSDAIDVIKEILKTVTDTGSGSDTVSASVDVSVQEDGQGQDQVVVSVDLAVQDTGHGEDTISTIQEKLVQIADAGQGADDVSVDVQVQLSEQGFAEESIAIQNTLTVIDQAQGVDSVVSFDTDVFIADITFSFAQRRFDYTFKQRSFSYLFKQRAFEYAFEGQN